MKRNHAGLLAIALVLGVSGAIAANIHARPNPQDPTYNWLSTSSAPNHPNSALLNSTVQQAKDYYGCLGTRDVCANGQATVGQGSQQIFINN